jgi:hypothetical protein
MKSFILFSLGDLFAFVVILSAIKNKKFNMKLKNSL